MKTFVVHVEATVYGNVSIEAENAEQARAKVRAENIVISLPVYDIEIIGVDEN